MNEYLVAIFKASKEDIDFITNDNKRLELTSIHTYGKLAEANKNLIQLKTEGIEAILISKSTILSLASHIISE